MTSLWKHYNPECSKYEKQTPFAYGWNREFAKEGPRYILGEDGYWYNPLAVESDTALLSCTGDLMCEPRMTNAYRYGDTYFFHPLFTHVRNIFKNSDFSIGNLETTLGEATPYAGDYHAILDQWHCNAPVCYLDALRYAGFDALVTANNHNCDAGISGLWDTLSAIDSYKFMHTGSFMPKDNERVLFVNICGFKVAVLSYGNRYNGIDEVNFTKEGIDTCLNYFSTEKCLREVAYARERGAEYIICYQHWGRDYVMEPNEQQLRILEEMRNCGVDYIVGSHTHCLQSHNIITDHNGKNIPMMWSMGNFVTNEVRELCKHTGILQLVLRRKSGKIEVEEKFVPCYVFDEFNTARFCVVPTNAALNGGYTHSRMNEINQYIRERVGEDIEFLSTQSLDLTHLCKIMGVENTLPNRPVTKHCTQSGTLCYGALYFDIGEMDYNDKRRIRMANVSAVVTNKAIEGFSCIVVPDVVEAYKKAYKAQRNEFKHLCVTVVAGHCNKTATRELTARALRTLGRVYTPKDAAHIDIAPWGEIHPSHDHCVLELRQDYPLDVDVVSELIQPDNVIITSSPCDVVGLAQSLASGGTLLYNSTDTDLCQEVYKIIRKDIKIVPYGSKALECKGLPFEFLNVCTSAAFEIAKAYGGNEKAIQKAIGNYELGGYNQVIMSVDGVNIIANTNCKTKLQAIGTVNALNNAERVIAVTTPAFKEIVSSKSDKVIIVDKDNDFNKAIDVLLEELKEGDTLLLCGEREALLCQVIRRMFGITDGFLPGCS